MEAPNSLDRRTLIKGAALAGTAAATAALLPGRARAMDDAPLPMGSVILFQGDSITDAGRDRRAEGRANHAGMLGRGYPHHIAAYGLTKYPELDLKIYNRGISGNKVPDLAARWDKDCIALKPAVISILIGVNDIWHKLNGKYDGTVEDYEKGYADLLEKTKAALPEVKLVVIEPFVLRCGAVNDKWFPEFDERRAAAQRVADGAGALFIPMQTVFDEAVAAGTKPEYWGRDGVHPSVAGHGLIAKTWIEAVNA